MIHFSLIASSPFLRSRSFSSRISKLLLPPPLTASAVSKPLTLISLQPHPQSQCSRPQSPPKPLVCRIFHSAPVPFYAIEINIFDPLAQPPAHRSVGNLYVITSGAASCPPISYVIQNIVWAVGESLPIP
ncbi:unnamed protein product [Arabidopsis thaliana]|uniref:Uncharacterized protein n=1 Tax=Arabidopsis thaliana TaxID=3702 RepID=A0A5S9XQJ4_ARATH|nr:unnamed protein product [Arabidopsis thaliana]